MLTPLKIDSPPEPALGKRAEMPFFVLACGLILTAIAAFFVAKNQFSQRRAEFNASVQDIEESIRSRMDSYVSLLLGGAGLMAADERVDASAFSSYVNRLSLPELYSGVQGFGYTARVRPEEMAALEEAMRVDRAPYKILQFNDFGLVAITRKRVKQSLERTLCSPCPHCEGAGYVKSVQTVVSEILTEARKLANSIEGKDVMLRVHPDVAKVIKSHSNKYLEELEETLRRPVLVKSDPQLHQEKFDLA